MLPALLFLLGLVGGALGNCACGNSNLKTDLKNPAYLIPPSNPDGTECPDLNCFYTLYAGGAKVRLSFLWFNLKTDYDYIIIYDGPTQSAQQIRKCTGPYCDEVVSSGDTLTVYFHTDSENNGQVQGFTGKFQAAGSFTKPTVQTTTGGGGKTTSAGQLTTTQYNGPSTTNNPCSCGKTNIILPPGQTTMTWSKNGYCNNMQCTYKLRASNNQNVGLVFNYFDTEGGNDNLTIYDGGVSQANLKIKCSGFQCNNGNPIYGSNGYFTAVFVSDESVHLSGWSASLFTGILSTTPGPPPSPTTPGPVPPTGNYNGCWKGSLPSIAHLCTQLAYKYDQGDVNSPIAPYGTKASLGCNGGYYLYGTSPSYTCQTDKTWSGSKDVEAAAYCSMNQLCYFGGVYKEYPNLLGQSVACYNLCLQDPNCKFVEMGGYACHTVSKVSLFQGVYSTGNHNQIATIRPDAIVNCTSGSIAGCDCTNTGGYIIY